MIALKRRTVNIIKKFAHCAAFALRSIVPEQATQTCRILYSTDLRQNDVPHCWGKQSAKKSSEPGNCRLILCDGPTYYMVECLSV